MSVRYLALPQKPSDAREVIEAMYRAWDFYHKPDNRGVLGSAEAERIYRELYAMANPTTPPRGA